MHELQALVTAEPCLQPPILSLNFIAIIITSLFWVCMHTHMLVHIWKPENGSPDPSSTLTASAFTLNHLSVALWMGL